MEDRSKRTSMFLDYETQRMIQSIYFHYIAIGDMQTKSQIMRKAMKALYDKLDIDNQTYTVLAPDDTAVVENSKASSA